MLVAMTGYYDRLPVSVRINCGALTSCISSDLVYGYNLPRHVATAPSGVAVVTLSGVMTVVADSGPWSARVPLRMQEIVGADVVLGLDWMHSVGITEGTLLCAVNAAAIGPSTSVASPSGPSLLSDVGDPLTTAGFMRLTVEQMRSRLAAHGIPYVPRTTVDAMQSLLVAHLQAGDCVQGGECAGCVLVREQHIGTGDVDVAVADARRELRVHYLRNVYNSSIPAKPLRLLLRSMQIVCSEGESRGKLRRRLRTYITTLDKGKSPIFAGANGTSDRADRYAVADTARRAELEAIRSRWPQLVAPSLKEKLVALFREQTGLDSLRQFTCACCSVQAPESERHEKEIASLPLQLLRCPQYMRHDGYDLPMPFAAGPEHLRDVLLDPAGVCNFHRTAHLCRSCASALDRERLPDLALANGLYVGDTVPPELADLTVVEEAMVALSRAKCCIVHLKDEKQVQDNKKHATRRSCISAARYCGGHGVNYLRQQATVSRYDANEQMEDTVSSETDREQVNFRNVVISDVDGNAPTSDLRAAALRHVKQKGGAFVQIPHDSEPVNEFCDPSLLPKIYPTLFPYGIGGPENPLRERPVSLKRHVRQLLTSRCRRFQTHRSFMFIVFNILQRREVLLRSKLKVGKRSFHRFAADVASVSPAAISRVCERLAEGEGDFAQDEEEKLVLRLMREVRLVTGNVPGTPASKLNMRNEIRATMTELGPPSFYLTLNPADLYNPLVQFLAGNEIDIDRLSRDDIWSQWNQSVLVAKNPVVAAQFFDICMRAFIDSILRFSPKPPHEGAEGGILGHVRAYYGCVESQGRGTLHCHMVVWIEGGLDPHQIRDRVLAGDNEFAHRLIQFLDGTISNEIPTHPDGEQPGSDCSPHPCSVRGPLRAAYATDAQYAHAAQADLHWLARKCQRHKHTMTCYKYVKPGEPRQCRFDLDEKNVLNQSSFNERGELNLRCLDGMVNNFNDTILRAIRCNMDIKFISSGEAAKAVIYYITDYITKSDLKAHVAYAALELAVKKLSVISASEDDDTVRAKRLLQKCAFALLSHQEMPAPQVGLFLLGKELSYRSHRYHNLYWTSMETFIEKQDPSPECRSQSHVEKQDGSPESTAADDIADEAESSVTDDECDDDEWDAIEDECDLENDDVVPEEVTVGTDADGTVVPVGDQLMDYVYRGPLLENISPWEFARCVEKVSGQPTEVSEVEHNIVHILQDARRRRPSCELLADHPEHSRRHLKVLHPQRRCIAVPIGPALPRRDRREIYARYCRLMLILFKPWRSADDLRNTGQTWEDAFSEFEKSAPEFAQKMIYNIQFLYECKDSREDHFRNRAHLRKMRMSAVADCADGDDNEYGDDAEDVDLLTHVGEVQEADSHGKARVNANVLSCLSAADRYGLYAARGTADCLKPSSANREHCMDVSDSMQSQSCEDGWGAYYRERRAVLKRTAIHSCQSTSTCEQTPQSSMTSLPSIGSMQSSTGHHPRLLQAQLHPPILSQPLRPSGDVGAFIAKWTLNEEQALAFEIIARTVVDGPSTGPLRMMIGGPGGTGKSRIIDAVRDFFEARGDARRFRLTSYTGVAARHISGMTLHSALCLSGDGALPRRGSKGHHDLASMWEGVDFLFVDEVSMIGCEMLAKISQALSLAKGRDEPFGGVNVIFAGDFAQLPPVGESRLFGHLNTSDGRRATKTRRQLAILGKLLWLSVETVVMLYKPMRQTGEHNQRFVELLERLRTGECTDDDYTLLCSRTLSAASVDLREPEWAHAPVIVYDNASKDALNVRAVHAFAQSTGEDVVWYMSTDKHKRRELQDRTLRAKLRALHSGETKGLLGTIPLVPGMRVIVTKNFDVTAGVVNGSVGTLASVRYALNSQNERIARSCVVTLPDADPSTIDGMPPNAYPIMQDTVSYRIKHKYSKKTLSINRAQIALQPAYAFTAHRAQGQTYERVVVDLQSCKGSESPYVMLSRATSLEGVLILRSFDKNKICCPPAQGLRTEWARLRWLELRTIMKWCSGRRAMEAQSALTQLGNDIPAISCTTIAENTEAREEQLRQLEQNADVACGGRKAHRET
ncbi:hypothetical protein NM688_g6398 [Phlebia brevispora]|uniref:Uncharacterized protein n=1 Tax=Phlebia brevispora TaxID=194682 RepID=A0ACC1SGJ8_9APHY|nr:hypothetical protein NM688_g6398 [Phlebia brevispora]